MLVVILGVLAYALTATTKKRSSTFSEKKSAPKRTSWLRLCVVQARFYVGAGDNSPLPQLSLAPPNLWLQQQYAVVKPSKQLYRGRVLEGWSG